MDQPPPSDPWLFGVLAVVSIASFATWFALAERRKHGPILSYEPRRPVPWSGFWAVVPLIFIALALLSTFVLKDDAADSANPPSVDDSLTQLALVSVQQVVLVGAFLVAAVASTRATRVDLGWPVDAAGLASDVRIGAIAWLAALVPVYGAQILMVSMMGEPKGHPLLKMLEKEADPTLFLAAFFVAVVVAPICEELTFRLLLQGWLEKWEDARLGWRGESRPTPSISDDAVSIEAGQSRNDETRMTNDEYTVSDHSSFDIRHSSFSDAQPPRLGLLGLPYGWLPILVSALLFAAVHVGYGPDPVPLFLLALILGYCYQRTHRIVPSIVTHALFNALSLFALWRVMSADR